MGGSLSSVGTSIATAHAHNIGSSIVTLPVISVVSTMPVIGARTTEGKTDQEDGGNGGQRGTTCQDALGDRVSAADEVGREPAQDPDRRADQPSA